VDYAKRAAELVQVDNIAGRWMPVLGGEYIVDPNGEHAGEQTERVRAWLAAELQAAHDAGVAERDAEVATLRQIISDAAREVGAQVAPECSLAFMALLPREIALALRRAEGGR